jgi:hypothetical protein
MGKGVGSGPVQAFGPGQMKPDQLEIDRPRRERLTIRGWTRTSLAVDRVLHPSAVNNTIRARFKSRCNVIDERKHPSSIFRSFLERRTSLESRTLRYSPDGYGRSTVAHIALRRLPTR